jgi:phosphate transport system substrate-binding protein
MRVTMKRKNIVIFLAQIFLLLASWKAHGEEVAIAVIVNPDNPVTNLSLADLRRIFSGEKRAWPGGTPIKLIVRGPGAPEREALLRLLGISEGQYKEFWTTQVFRGEAESEPIAVPSFGMEKEAITALRGGIAMVEANKVKPDMKVVKIDGLLPGEPGYKLH